MTIRSLKDINDACNSGRYHVQRFLKNAGGSGDNRWHDWSYASGQPAFDARIGTALAFTPCVASRNDAVYFPPAPGLDRRLMSVDLFTLAGGTGQARVQTQICDLVGYYPLIDGDSTDVQDLDNAIPLPRYVGGEGLQMVLVNHVAPALGPATVEVIYTNSQGVTDRTVTVTTHLAVTGSVGSGLLGAGELFAQLVAGDTGVASIQSVRFITPPGGLWCIYLVKPYTSFANRGGEALGGSAFAEKPIAIMDAWRLPKVEDGAWLTVFYMTTGLNRTASLFGNFHFIWG